MTGRERQGNCQHHQVDRESGRGQKYDACEFRADAFGDEHPESTRKKTLSILQALMLAVMAALRAAQTAATHAAGERTEGIGAKRESKLPLPNEDQRHQPYLIQHAPQLLISLVGIVPAHFLHKGHQGH
jgi:hypothetical protein